MRNRKSSDQRHAIVVERTEGDFPHARRRTVRLACCSCTSCCFTFLLAGVGGLAGITIGIAKACRSKSSIRNPMGAIVIELLRFLVYIVVYSVAGLLIGAGFGFGLDTIVGVFR